MTYENIILTEEESIATLTINRPNKLNALNKKTLEEISRALEELRSRTDIRVIILTGSGEKAFVAGADIAEFSSFSVSEGRALSADGHVKVFDKVQNFPKPIIAAVNGFALGGGLELSMAAHIRVASESARMGLPEVTLGLIPGYGGTQRLPQLVGKGRAMEMIFTGGMVNAQDAYRMGLVNHVVSPGSLMSFCKELAEKISKNSPTAIEAAIKAVNFGFEEGMDGFEKEIDEFGSCFGSEDFKEGTTAFLEKRKPFFKGN